MMKAAVTNNVQLLLTAGMPTLAVLVGIFINGLAVQQLSARMTALENRILAFEAKFDARFDMLMSKIVDMDNRLTRLE